MSYIGTPRLNFPGLPRGSPPLPFVVHFLDFTICQAHHKEREIECSLIEVFLFFDLAEGPAGSISDICAYFRATSDNHS